MIGAEVAVVDAEGSTDPGTGVETGVGGDVGADVGADVEYGAAGEPVTGTGGLTSGAFAIAMPDPVTALPAVTGPEDDGYAVEDPCARTGAAAGIGTGVATGTADDVDLEAGMVGVTPDTP